jgi:peroxiredoxin
MRGERWRLAAVICGVLATAPLNAGKFNRQLSIGDAAPAWSGLIGTDGKTYATADWKDAPAIVVLFTCNHCPVAQAYTERIKRLAAEFQPRGVKLLAISVSRLPADNLERMTARATEQNYNFPYVIDPTQETGRQYGATCTPHAFLLDGNRKIAYMGAVDDHWQAAEHVEDHYLRDAIEAVLAGRKPEIAETRQTGCGIEYEPRP